MERRHYYEQRPARIEFGLTVWCPHCKGKGNVITDGHKNPCNRCNGIGVVPNVGIVDVARTP